MTASNLADGKCRKSEALDALAKRRAVYVRQGRRALLLTLLAGRTATADDVRAAVKLPAEVNPKCLGAVPGTLARAGIIEPAGFQDTTRPEGHARPVTVWRLVDRAKAEQWLEDHRDQADARGCGQAGPRQGLLFDVAEPATAAGF